MKNNPRSHNLEEILAGYVLGDLDEEELIWLNKQLVANPQLREQVTQLESTLNLMPYGLPEDVPQNDLRSQIVAQAKPKQASPKYRWGWIIGTVTAVGTLILSINNFSLRRQIAAIEARLEQQQELIGSMRRSNNQLVTLKPHNDTVTASGSLFISLESNTAVLTLENLDALSGNQVYRLWAISQGKKIGCSTFSPNAKGEVHLDLSSDDAIFNASSISVTIEPKPDTEQPIGREFLSGSYAEI